MSNQKKYTAQEVAIMIADRAAEIMKKHEISSEYFEQILEKSKNTAHEIDKGEEPKNDEAECPPSLCDGIDSGKSESSESASMEDEPLQGDEDSDTEEEEVDEEEEDEYEFKKSEACGHIIEYKRLTKKENRCWEGYEPTPGKKAYSEGSCQKKNEDMDKCGDMTKDEGMSVEQAVSMIMSDKHGVDDVMDKVPAAMRGKVMAALRNKDAKKAEMCKGYMEKCGDMKVVKSEDGMHTIQYERLNKGYMQKAKIDEGISPGKKHKVRSERNVGFEPHQKEKFTTDGYRKMKIEDPNKQQKMKQKLQEKHPKMPSQNDLEYPMAASEDGENGSDNADTGYKTKKAKTMSDAQNATFGSSFKSGLRGSKKGHKGDSSPGQIKGEAAAKKIRQKMRQEGLLKEEMDKCGDMTSAKKLKKFMGKQKQPSPGMVQKIQE